MFHLLSLTFAGFFSVGLLEIAPNAGHPTAAVPPPIKVSVTPRPQDSLLWGLPDIRLSGCHAGGCYDVSYKEIQVDSAEALAQALASATGGETIVLAAGDYGKLSLGSRGIKTAFGDTVTLKSADPSDPAVISSLQLNGAKNVTFDGLHFDYSYRPGDKAGAFLANVQNSSDISFVNSRFTGDPAVSDDPAIDGYPYGLALRVSGSSAITVENCRISEVWKGVQFIGSSDVVLRSTEIFGVRSDGLNLIDAQGVLIENNHFHDFERAYESGDHADMIQAWSSGDPARVLRDLTIRGNLFDIGEGGWTQSIFLPNKEVDRDGAGDEFRYQNITIENNTIINDHIAGIRVGATDGLVIRNNTLLHDADEHSLSGNPARSAPRIHVSDLSTNVEIERNIVSRIVGTDGQADWTVSDNVLVQDQNRLKPGFFDTIFDTPFLSRENGLPDLGFKVGGPADTLGAGAAPYTPIGAITAPTPDQPVDKESRVDEFDFGNALLYRADFGASAGLMRGASLVETAEGTDALHLQDGAYYKIGQLQELQDSQNFALAIDFTRDGAAGKRVMLAENLQRMQIELVDNRLKLSVATEDGIYRIFSDRVAALNDDGRHTLMVSLDAEIDILRATIDGEQIFEETGIDYDPVGSTARERGWTIGSPWGAEAYDITIHDFQIADFDQAVLETNLLV